MAIDTTPKTRGEPSIQSLASGLGTLGRYGDNYMVHAAEGETFVPKEILDANPNLKSALFQQMKMMGIEDPNRYVVGDALNSINPITGQPEFFFKKIWSKIKKVVKSIAPVVAPIIGNMILPGIGGLLASGLASKISGGSWGDALKAMATSYALQGVASGFSGKGGFSMDKLQKGFTTPFKALGDLPGSFDQGIFGSAGYTKMLPQYDPEYDPTAAQEAAEVKLLDQKATENADAWKQNYTDQKYEINVPNRGPSDLTGDDTLFGGVLRLAPQQMLNGIRYYRVCPPMINCLVRELIPKILFLVVILTKR